MSNRNILYVLGAVVLIFVAMWAFGVYAQDAVVVEQPNTIVDFSPFISEVIPYIMTLLAAVVSAALAWVAKKVHEWTGIQVEEKHREALQSALMNGARLVAGKLPTNVALDVKSVILKEGVDFVLRSVPDAIKYFDLDAGDVERHLEPKIALAAAEVSTVMSGGTSQFSAGAPVTVETVDGDMRSVASVTPSRPGASGPRGGTRGTR